MRRVSWNCNSFRYRWYIQVTPRMRRVSWNIENAADVRRQSVTPRMRRVSWNDRTNSVIGQKIQVTPRMRRVSWNLKWSQYVFLPDGSRLAWGVWVEISEKADSDYKAGLVTPRMRRVSWNSRAIEPRINSRSHASHEACELKLQTGNKVLLWFMSRLAWGVWVEIFLREFIYNQYLVTPRMRRVSWNMQWDLTYSNCNSVTPRMRRVSWNMSVE